MGEISLALVATVGLSALAVLIVIGVIINQYKRCPSNRILVIYGKVGGGRSAKCIHGGGAFVIPVIQDYQFLSLQPMPIEINLTGALSKQNIRVNVPSTFTVAISTDPAIMNNAAERLLGLDERQIKEQAQEIILGQLRLVIATLTIEEINRDREVFLQQVNKNVAAELHKLGLELLNVNVRDITDASGYIEAIGKKSAAEAINKARVEVAEQERFGAVGEAKAVRERTVQVALEATETEKGKKEAERTMRMVTAQLEAEAAIAEAQANRKKTIDIAAERAEAEVGVKRAEAQQRISIAELEAETAAKENMARAAVIESNAMLAEWQAAAQQRAEVAKANAEREILIAQRQREKALLEKEELVRQEIEKLKRQVEADAEAERIRRVAQGEADAILLKYKADADGMKQLLLAKAEGYHNIIRACGNDPDTAAKLILLEKLETIVEKQVEAIANLKIDKITVWDSGGNGDGSSTAHFIRNFVSSLPPLQEIARQAGVELPAYLGSLVDSGANGKTEKTPSRTGTAAPKPTPKEG